MSNTTDDERRPLTEPPQGEPPAPDEVVLTPGNGGAHVDPLFTRAGLLAFLRSKAGKQVLLLLGLFIILLAVNWYAGHLADEKTAEWLYLI